MKESQLPPRQEVNRFFESFPGFDARFARALMGKDPMASALARHALIGTTKGLGTDDEDYTGEGQSSPLLKLGRRLQMHKYDAQRIALSITKGESSYSVLRAASKYQTDEDPSREDAIEKFGSLGKLYLDDKRSLGFWGLSVEYTNSPYVNEHGLLSRRLRLNSLSWVVPPQGDEYEAALLELEKELEEIKKAQEQYLEYTTTSRVMTWHDVESYWYPEDRGINLDSITFPADYPIFPRNQDIFTVYTEYTNVRFELTGEPAGTDTNDPAVHISFWPKDKELKETPIEFTIPLQTSFEEQY